MKGAVVLGMTSLVIIFAVFLRSKRSFIQPMRLMSLQIYKENATKCFEQFCQSNNETTFSAISARLHICRLIQRTVRSETTKDKAGALPPVIYTTRADSITRVSFRRDQEISADLPDKTDAEGPNVPVPKGVSLISFVDDCTIEVVHASQSTQVSNPDCDFGEEYETDSDNSLFSDDEPDYVTNKPVITRSGRQVKAWAKFDV